MADAGRLRFLAGGLGLAVPVFVAACFVLPAAPAYALVFYAGVLPCVAARLVFEPLPRGAAFWCGAALIVWSGLTLIWGRDDGGRSFAMAAAACCTLAFWFALETSLRLDATRMRMAQLLAGLGAANGLLAIVRYFLWPAYVVAGQPKRLHGWGITYHPVLGAAVFSVCFLTALHLAVGDRHHRAWWLAAAALIGAAILLTGSRGPELAACFATLVLVAAGPARRWAPVALGAVPLAGIAWWAGLIRAGDSGHLDVWRLAWSQIVMRPWLGYGLAADLPAGLGADKRFPHDLYLSLLFYSGAVGLLLFVLWAGLLIGGTARRGGAERAWLLALWINGLLAGLTDFGQITKGPGPLWLVIWLPAALSLRKKAVLF